ncbi:unnamed protein product [Gongylonema pulchrum]|uniref:Ricin B-type lectin domain-containing protein n=1 Tax=Gongylonema pulchrum TaxID=637853 RepID=A0A183ESI6_9BILA|nr:unnamed protein product [Gongylonema pulchrum]
MAAMVQEEISQQERNVLFQEWVLNTQRGHLKSPYSKLCLTDDEKGTLILQNCNVVKGRWQLDEGNGRLLKNGQCVALLPDESNDSRISLALMPCDATDERQRWTFEKPPAF